VKLSIPRETSRELEGYHSVFRVEHFKGVPHFASKLAIENALREFDVPFNVIRPHYFFQNDAKLKDAHTKAGIHPMPLGQVGVSAVAIRDIAEATAIALTSDGHYGKTYNLNGTELLSGPKIGLTDTLNQRQIERLHTRWGRGKNKVDAVTQKQSTPHLSTRAVR
jgi:uncharacterized protein YbjT (DUF2867 family)